MSNERYRQLKLINILEQSSEPMTTTQLYNQLFFDFNLNVARKTVSRDLEKLANLGILQKIPGAPAKFSHIKCEKYILEFSRDELYKIIDLLSREEHPLCEQLVDKLSFAVNRE